ncbi:MAG: twin-arginine translocation signal domain-containing protein [Gammaproteobacteria bacterium]|nr:twin-arginine translocation signal domain-containing protein [Gammaproteobacteria bacterium]
MNIVRRDFIKLTGLAALGVTFATPGSWAAATSQKLRRPDELIDYDAMGLAQLIKKRRSVREN